MPEGHEHLAASPPNLIPRVHRRPRYDREMLARSGPGAHAGQACIDSEERVDRDSEDRDHQGLAKFRPADKDGHSLWYHVPIDRPKILTAAELMALKVPEPRWGRFCFHGLHIPCV